MPKKKILIIDDEEDFSTLLKTNIEKTTAYEALVARSGEAGLELMTMHTPDLVPRSKFSIDISKQPQPRAPRTEAFWGAIPHQP